MFRKFAVALVAVLPLAAQVTETPAVMRVDVVVTDAQGNRIRGLDIADFEITENGERRAIESFEEFSADAKPAPAVTDTRFVALVAPASPAPPRRLMLLYSDPSGEAAAKLFVASHRRPDDIVTMTADTSAPAIAAAIIELARYPEKRALIVFGQASEKAASFARRRGVTLYDAATLANAADDLASYYSVAVRSTHTAPLSIRTTRQYNVRATAIHAPLTIEDSVSDAVIAQHAAASTANDLGITLRTEPDPAAGATRKVKLHVIIPIRNLQLAREGDKVTGGFDVFVSLGGAKGGFSPVTKRTHAISWPPEAQTQAGERTLDYVIDVVMDAGRSHISVGVVDQRSKKTGFQRIEVSG